MQAERAACASWLQILDLHSGAGRNADGVRRRETRAKIPVIAINPTGVFLCMKYEIPLMLKHDGARL
jgi:hypothetical protein